MQHSVNYEHGNFHVPVARNVKGDGNFHDLQAKKENNEKEQGNFQVPLTKECKGNRIKISI